jgi:hypothetical protein
VFILARFGSGVNGVSGDEIPELQFLQPLYHKEKIAPLVIQNKEYFRGIIE